MNRFYFLSVIVFLVSCSKDTTVNQQQDDPCKRIIEVQDYHPYDNPTYQTTALLTYDDQGRVKSVKGELQNESTYTYYSDRIELKGKDIYGTDISQVYYLDNMGRITRTKAYDYDFTYDANGYLISYKQPYGNNDQILGFNEYQLRYENGNLIEVSTDDPNVSRKTVTLEYSVEENQDLIGYNSPLYLSEIIQDRNTFFLIKGGFFGKTSKNLLKSLDFHNGFPAGEIRYIYDDKGRITEMENGYRFNYQCP